jgi:two-component system osmolarity sensor histidine kinase EnvZ
MKLALAMMPHDPALGAELDALQADIEEMERMLDDYLAFARGEGGEESGVTDLAALVRDTASGVARAKPGGPARLTVVSPEAAQVTVKPAALKRCLTNLIDNAFKHGRQVTVTLNCDARWAAIAVEDDGPGIPEARREEAFRPFHRLDQGRNLQKGGSGLGLAIARDIARAHGGDIVLDQSAMGGVKAVIKLPV